MSDVEGRVDDYEKRLLRAGSTDDLMGGLSRAVRRNRRVTRWLVVSVVLDIMLSVGLGAVALKAQHNAHRVEVNTDRISMLIRARERSDYASCLAEVRTYTKLNESNLAMVKVEEDATYPTALEQALSKRRISSYVSALIVPLPTCTKP